MLVKLSAYDPQGMASNGVDSLESFPGPRKPGPTGSVPAPLESLTAQIIHQWP